MQKQAIFSFCQEKEKTIAALFPFPPTSRQFQLISVTSGFTRLSIMTKYVCRGLIGLYVNFHNNQTMWSKNLHVINRRWGERKKSHNCVNARLFFLKKDRF